MPRVSFRVHVLVEGCTSPPFSTVLVVGDAYTIGWRGKVNMAIQSVHRRTYASHFANGFRTMKHKSETNNQRLRELIKESGLTQAQALAVFNRGMGARPYSLSAMKAFLSSPDAVRFRALSDNLLAHAEKQFARLKKG